MERILCILISLLIFAQAFAIRRSVGTWVFPACFFCLFWFLATFPPLFVAPEAPVNPLAMLFILLSCLSFSLPAIFFDWREAFAANVALAPARFHVYRSWLLKLAFFTSAILSVVFWIIFSATQGFSVARMFGDIMGSAQAFMGARYDQRIQSNFFSQAANILGYLAPILGGIIYRFYQKKRIKVIIVALGLLPSVFVMITQAGKGALFLSITFFYAGILLSRLADGKATLLEEKLKMRTAVLAFAALFGIITVSLLARGVYQSADAELVYYALKRYWISYSSAHLYAFSDWFSFYIGADHIQPYPVTQPSYGFFTITSIFRWMGDTRELAPGVYEEYYQLGEFLNSNIYTVFRGLIQDYGLAASQAVLLAYGAVSHLAFRTMLAKRFSPFSSSFFVTMMGAIYTSFIISLFIWDSVYATFVVVGLGIAINAMIVVHFERAPGMGTTRPLPAE